MTVYPIWVLADSDHYTKGRTHIIDTLVLHATAGTDSLNWLTRTSNPPVSAHILVTKSGKIIRIVKDEDTAWHAGYGQLQIGGGPKVNVNARSLGLELENLNDGIDTYPEAQLESVAEVVAQWALAYGWLYVVRHSDIDSRKSDPRGLDVEGLLDRAAGKLCDLR
jgi:N-acetylmuramoyl-L-alanine amidase